MSNFYLYKWQYNLHDDDLGIHLIFFKQATVRIVITCLVSRFFNVNATVSMLTYEQC